MSETPNTDTGGRARAWAIHEAFLPLIARFEGGAVAVDDVAELKAAFGEPDEAPPPSSGVAVVPLRGVLRGAGGGLLSMLFGNPLDRFRGAFSAAVGNRDVNAIVLDVNSPGGSTDLISEVATEVRAARGSKPIVAVSNTLAASAAYWIASQADELVVTPSGEVGSIGVFALHEDISAMAEMEGVKLTLISAGKYKVEGNPFEPLGDEARAAIQAGVDDFYGMFVNDVAKGRDVRVGEVRSGFGEGRALTARRAVDEGMADRVATRDETIARLSNARRRARVGADEDPQNRAMLWHDLQMARGR